MKNKSNRLAKIVIAITSSIILMLFLLFSFTYDFTKEDKYIKNVETPLYDKINETFSNLNNLNYLRLEITPEELGCYVSDAIKQQSGTTSNYIYEGMYWTIKGLNFKIIGENILVNIYAKYSRNINYNLKIGVLLGVDEEDDLFKVRIKSVSFGSIVIPYNIIKNALKDINDGTIGWLFNYLFNVLMVEVDLDNSMIIVKKDFLYIYPETNYFIKSLDLKDESIPIYIAYMKAILKENKRMLEINDTINLSLSYNSFINELTNTDISKKTSIENKSYTSNISEDILSILIGRTTVLNNEFLEEYSTYKNKEKLSNKYWFDTSYIKMNVIENDIHIKLYIYYPGLYSVVDYVFDGSSFELKNIFIGKDANESIYYDASQEKAELLEALGFFFDINNEKLEFYMDIEQVNTSSLNIKQDETVIEDINQALLDDNLYKNINIDHGSIDEVVASYKLLSESKKDLFLNDLKDYFINKIVVYNYIVQVLR